MWAVGAVIYNAEHVTPVHVMSLLLGCTASLEISRGIADNKRQRHVHMGLHTTILKVRGLVCAVGRGASRPRPGEPCRPRCVVACANRHFNAVEVALAWHQHRRGPQRREF